MKTSVLTVVLMLIISSIGSHAQEVPAPPIPEQHHVDPQQYVREARAFLENQTRSPHAPRVALDLLIHAVDNQLHLLADEMRYLLISRYANSPTGRYVATTFKDAEAYRDLLDSRLDSNFADPSDVFAQEFLLAVALGVREHGQEVVENEGFAIKTAILARAAGAKDLENLLRERVIRAVARKEEDSPLHEIVRISFAAMEDGERIAALGPLLENTLAGELVGHFWSQLPEAQRHEPRIVRVAVETLLHQSRLAEALPLLDRLADQVDAAQLGIWRGWCQAAAGNHRDAAATLRGVVESNAQSPWAEVARQMLPAVENLRQNLDAHATALTPAIARLLAETEQLEILATDASSQYTVYFALVPRRYIELQVWQSPQNLLFAYRTDTDSAALHAAGVTHRFRQGGMIGVPQFELLHQLDGGFSFTGGMQLRESVDELPEVTDMLRLIPLRTRRGVLDLLEYQVKRGTLPLPPQAMENGHIVLDLITPTVTQSQTVRWYYELGPDHSLRSFGADTVAIRNFRYGPAGSFELAPPQWPDGQSIDHENFDVMVAMQLAMQFAEYVQEFRQGR